MEKRLHLYVKRKHMATWLMAAFMIASVVTTVVMSRDKVFTSSGILCGIVMPCVCAIWYALTVLLSGEERFYKTAIPVWVLGISYAVQLKQMMQGDMLLYVMACICILFFCICYTTITSGRRKPWLLLPLYLLDMGGLVYAGEKLGWNVLPDLLMLAGMLVLLFSLKIHTDDKYHPTWGDRIDGRRIRTAPAMEQITAYFMPNRNGANNMFEESVEITELERYVRRKRREGLPNFGMSHVIMAAYVRTVAKYPALNRFIAGQKIYSRGEDIALCMTVKKEMRADAPDSVIKVHLHPADTAADVYRKFHAQVEIAKDEMENTTADNTANYFMMIPSLVLKFVMWLLKTLDYFGLVPAFLLEVSPFHGSVYFTSMGSLGIKPVYHHLYDFGTVPAFCAFGRKRRAEEIKDGEIVERKYVDLKFNLDERICDGFYYAGVIKYFLRLLTRPDVLDEIPETIEQDIP